MSAIGVRETTRCLPDWDAATFCAKVPGGDFSPDLAGRAFTVGGDVVSSAPELAG
jgi:hypothetical protein